MDSNVIDNLMAKYEVWNDDWLTLNEVLVPLKQFLKDRT